MSAVLVDCPIELFIKNCKQVEVKNTYNSLSYTQSFLQNIVITCICTYISSQLCRLLIFIKDESSIMYSPDHDTNSSLNYTDYTYVIFNFSILSFCAIQEFVRAKGLQEKSEHDININSMNTYQLTQSLDNSLDKISLVVYYFSITFDY